MLTRKAGNTLHTRPIRKGIVAYPEVGKMKYFLIALIPVLLMFGCVPDRPVPVINAGQRAVEDLPQAEDDPGSGDPVRGGTLVLSFGAGTPRHLNPALVSGSATAVIGAQIFASPLRYDKDWSPQPYLAESWEVSENGLEVTLHLVDGALFHDGEPVTSEDVAFSVMTVKKYHPFKSMFEPVDWVETPDDRTAVIHLSTPHPAILLAMSPALLPILPEHIYGDGRDLATHPANLQPVGAGPFRFSEYVENESITLERFEHYFIPGQPYLDRIVMLLENNPDAQRIELERQTAHIASLVVNPENLTLIKGSEHLSLTPHGHEGLGPLVWLAFNLLRPPLDDIRVRQAIAYGIDTGFISSYMHQGWSEPAYGPIVSSSPFYNPDLKKYNLDIEKAKELLDLAGYTVQADGSRFSLGLDYIPVLPSQFKNTALYIKGQLKLLGINVILHHSGSFPVWGTKIAGWDFDMTLDSVYNWGDPVIGVHRTYQSGNIRKGVLWSNTQNYRNNEVDALLEKAAVETDFEKRKSLYFEFQQIINDELPLLPINIVPLHTVYHKNLGNPPLTIWGVHSPLDGIYWKKSIEIEYSLTPRVEEGEPLEDVVSAGIMVLNLLQHEDFYTARKMLSDRAAFFKGSTDKDMFVMGFRRDGAVFLDNSGQFTAGMDISGLLDGSGIPVLPVLIDAADRGNLETLIKENFLPNPSTQKFDPVSLWCGYLTPDEIICVTDWAE
jgi:peptide/nickel transport system substrate-binding protein